MRQYIYIHYNGHVGKSITRGFDAIRTWNYIPSNYMCVYCHAATAQQALGQSTCSRNLQLGR